LQLLENKGLLAYEESIKTLKKSKNIWSKIYNYFKIILREKEDFFYHNLVDSFKKPEDCHGNELKEGGFKKIIDTMHPQNENPTVKDSLQVQKPKKEIDFPQEFIEYYEFFLISWHGGKRGRLFMYYYLFTRDLCRFLCLKMYF
jgi:hypothetical protein